MRDSNIVNRKINKCFVVSKLAKLFEQPDNASHRIHCIYIGGILELKSLSMWDSFASIGWRGS